MVDDTIFLNDEQIDHLTGIKRGAGGRSKYQLQVDFLRKSAIVHFVNARGRAVVTKSAIEGRRTETARPKWQPKFA